jgi:hypothetical protein
MIDVTAHNGQTGISFPGIITLPSGDEVDADLELGPHGIRLSTAGSTVGEWGLDECRLEASGDGSFELVADDEVVGFAPEDPDGFWMAFLTTFEAHRREADTPHLRAVPSPEVDDADEDVPEPAEVDPVVDREIVEPEGVPEPEITAPASEEDAARLRSGRIRLAEAVTGARARFPQEDDEGGEPVAVSDQILADLRSKTKVRRFSGEDVRDVAKKAGIVVAAVAVVALLAWTTPQVIGGLRGGPAEATTGTAPTTSTSPAPSTTAPPEGAGGEAPSTTVVVPPSVAFDLPAPEFFAAWNEVGGEITSVLEFSAYPPAGPFENEFTAFLRSEGVIGRNGTLDSFSVVVDPLGPTGSDRLGLQTLGVLIAVVDPSVSPQGRAQILGSLGLDVRDPQLAGIDGRTVRNGVAYRLVYDPDAVLLVLTAAPAS